MGIRTRTSGIMININVEPSGFVATCAEASAFLARATGITSDTDKQNYNDLICGLKSDGVWAKLDGLYIFAAPDAATARLNLIQSAFNLTEHGTVTFSATHGFTSNGTTGYEDSVFNPTTAGGLFVRDSCHISIYTTANLGVVAGIGMGAFDGAVFVENSFSGGNNCNNFIDDATALNDTTVANKKFFILTRTASNARAAYSDGTLRINDAQASTGLLNAGMFILARNNSGPDNFLPAQICAASFGGGLSATDVTNFNTRMSTFQTAYGN